MIFVTGVIVPLAGREGAMSHGHTMFLFSRISKIINLFLKALAKNPHQFLQDPYRSSYIVGLMFIPVGVQHWTIPITPGVLILH